MNRTLLACFAVCLLLPTVARAQSDDAAYCGALTNTYRRYLGNSAEGKMVPDVSIAVAMDKCQKGNFAEGIPVLEAKLKANGFTLPKR
jgi:hypothetical protein